MISCSELLDCLEAAGVDFFVGVPTIGLISRELAARHELDSRPSCRETRVAKGILPAPGHSNNPPKTNESLFMETLSR